MVVQFLTIKPYRWKISDGQFYTFLNFTRSSAQGLENFIHSKILQAHQLKVWKILYIQKSYKVIIWKGGKFYTFSDCTKSLSQCTGSNGSPNHPHPHIQITPTIPTTFSKPPQYSSCQNSVVISCPRAFWEKSLARYLAFEELVHFRVLWNNLCSL